MTRMQSPSLRAALGQALIRLGARIAGHPAPGLEAAAPDVARDDTRGQDELISTVSHELRVPLAAIRGALSVMRGGSAGATPPDIAAMLDMAERNADRMLELVDDLLDAGQVAAGGLLIRPRPVDLNGLLGDMVETARVIAAPKGVTIGMAADTAPVPVSGDPRRLAQAITNLLSNAVKFSEPGGTVTVSLEAAGGTATVTVADHGPGIPAELQPRIFDRFWTRDAGDGRNASGTGLGLGIARAIVEAHSGRMGFTSAPGDTRFRIELPLSPSPAERGTAPNPETVAGTARQEPGTAPRRILCVDDDPDIRELIEIGLSAAGEFELKLCGSGREALTAVGDFAPDLVLLDVVMPDMDGPELMQALGRHPNARGCKTIFLTAAARSGDLQRLEGLGADAIITKPFDPLTIAGRIRAAIGAA